MTMTIMINMHYLHLNLLHHHHQSDLNKLQLPEATGETLAAGLSGAEGSLEH